jgi:hypothetical protein
MGTQENIKKILVGISKSLLILDTKFEEQHAVWF